MKCGGTVIATSRSNGFPFRTGDFVDVYINFGTDGRLDLAVNTTNVCKQLFVPLLPTAGRFGLGARTGGLNDNHWVDNLNITTITDLLYPTVRSISPSPVNVRGDATIGLTILDGTATQLKQNSIELWLNGIPITPTASSAAGETKLTYTPPHMFAPGSSNSITLNYSDSAGNPYSFGTGFKVAPYFGPNGNIFEVVLSPNHITWPDAKIAAEQRSYAGQQGHLATITSFDEDLYLENLRRASRPIDGGSQLWVGGYQDPIASPPGDNWHWLNNEGPFSGFTGGPDYSNWLPGEPNDNFGWATENYLAIGLNGNFGWNDDGYFGDGRNDGTLDGYAVEYEAPQVAIDIKPGATPNVINLLSTGKIPVAVLSSATFDAATVHPATITFGHSGTEAAPASFSLTDVNGDGRKDLVCQFNTQDTGLLCSDTNGLLKGATRAGWPIKGSDSIQTVGCPVFALSLVGMQDVHQLTDVYPTINVPGGNCPPPAIAQHIQIKSLDLLGRTRWSANAAKVPLVLGPNNSSTGDLQYSDLLRHQNIQAEVQVQSCQGNNMLVLRQQGVVLLRPDLTVTSVTAPESAPSGIVVNIAASIAEMNGDLGGTGSVYLVEGPNVLDKRDWIGVGPSGQAIVFFSTVLGALGTHHLKIVIGNETPSDYDGSNNEKQFAIEVVQQPAYYSATYNHYIDQRSEEYNWPWWQAGTNYQNVNDESLSQTLYIPGTLSFPLKDVRIKTFIDRNLVDSFDLANLDADYSDFYYTTLFRHLADGVDLYVTSYSFYQQSYAQFYRSAANDVYYSVYHNIYWGDGGSSYTTQYGSYLNATTSAGVRFVIESGGTAWGGSTTIPVYSYSWDYPFDYEDHDSGAYDRGYDRGSSTYGSNSGYVTP